MRNGDVLDGEVLDDARAVREELRAVTAEQAALRRVSLLTARGAPPAAVFAAVAKEAGRLLHVDFTMLGRYEPGGKLTSVGAWSRTGRASRPVPAAPVSRADAPVSIDGRLWGSLLVVSRHDRPLTAGTRIRLARFTELTAASIATAEAHAELIASRARIAAAADETRRRIERDLHDGAQQRLVWLGLQLQAARAAVPAELEELRAELGCVLTGLTSALDELRNYARGIHPAVLTEGGLVPALKGLARRSPVPVTLDLPSGPRLPERAEVTAYYVVSEALVNAARHASAAAVRVTVDMADEIVRLSISDDGVGGADPARGSGLACLADRVAAAGGTLRVDSPPGRGTRLTVRLPC